MTSIHAIDLTQALNAPASKRWSVPSTELETSFGGVLALVEVPRFEDNDINKGCSSVIDERGFSARCIVVAPDGKRRTPVGYQETDCAFSTTGRMAGARTFSAATVGLSEAGDYQRAHNPITTSQETRLLVEPQLYTGEITGRLEPSQFNGSTEAVAISPDGTTVAFVERLLTPEGHSCALWEEGLDGGRRLLAVQQEDEYWESRNLDYSPCGAWLLVNSTPLRIVDRLKQTSVTLPTDLLQAAWDPSATGRIVATKREDGELRLIRFDLRSASETDAWHIRMHSRAPQIGSLSLSHDGRWLACVAPLGLSDHYVAEHGTGRRAFVIDLYDGTAELVLPVYFECGVERDIQRVRWVQGAQRDERFELPNTLYDSVAQPIDFGRSSPEARDFLANEAKGGYQLIVEALEKGAPLDGYYEEFLRFCEALYHNDRSLQGTIAQVKDYAFGQFLQGGMKDRLWLSLSGSLQELLEGERPTVTRPTMTSVSDDPHK
jgi:hypothetical protein